ncbi:MAG: sigma-70 family RNA polymerase sigma factor [Thermodesulfobacteriota bacterium]
MSKKPPPRMIFDEDGAVIEAVRSGEKELFNRLISKYQRDLFNFGQRLCPEQRDAEEMVQDTFFTAYRYLNRFRFESKFRTWLYKIAGSVCTKKRKKTRGAREKEIPLQDFLKEEDIVGSKQPPAWISEPLEKLINRELSEQVRKAVTSLPEKYRLVLVLRDLEGFSTEETASLLHLRPETVKVRLHRGRFFLKEKLKGYYEEHRK